MGCKGVKHGLQATDGVSAVVIANQTYVGRGVAKAVVAVAAQAATLQMIYLDVIAQQRGGHVVVASGGAVLPRHDIADVGLRRQYQVDHIVDAAIDGADEQLECHEVSSSWCQKSK